MSPSDFVPVHQLHHEERLQAGAETQDKQLRPLRLHLSINQSISPSVPAVDGSHVEVISTEALSRHGHFLL